MSATRADTYTNELKNTKDRQSRGGRNHLREQHDMEPEDIAQSFRILRNVSEQIWLSYFWNVFLSKNWNRRLTNSAIQFAPNYLFRVVLVNIVLFPLFFDFINIFSTFYIFTYFITF